jgi:multimeric flavodoxin WrbA
MKVLAFNGSPRMKKGVTDSLVERFLQGAASAGAQTETVYVAKHKIN